MTNRWRGQARWLRRTVLALVVLLLYGAAVHVVQLLTSGGDPYPGLPGWLRGYFVFLTVLDRRGRWGSGRSSGRSRAR